MTKSLIDQINNFDFKDRATFSYSKDYNLLNPDDAAEYYDDIELIEEMVEGDNDYGSFFKIKVIRSSVFDTHNVEVDFRLWKKNAFGV